MSVFQPVRGVEIPCAHLLRQAHEVTAYDDEMSRVRANVSAENLDALFCRTVATLNAPLCFILELPCVQARELELRKSPDDCYHREVYYIDDLTQEEALGIYDTYSELLVNDGMVYYGIGSLDAEEIFVGSFKLVSIYTRQYNRMAGLLAEFDVPKVDTLVEARSTFTRDSPGRKSLITVDGKTVYDMLESLKAGTSIYLAKTIED